MAASDDKSREHLDDSAELPSSSASGAERQSGGDTSAAERPVLPQRSTDETDLGWGDRAGGYDDDWYLSERPPHHG
ncbi:MAG TPA: hypothetical protein VHO01_14450 [Jatrophihabitans sp.]|nr:hypothetical protein [Jatrophihabitans sp.]